MTKNKLQKLLKTVLPKDWKLGEVESKWFIVKCPVQYKLGVTYGTFRKYIRKIVKATGAEDSGSGYEMGSPWYEVTFRFN